MRAWQSIGFRLFFITGLLVMAGCGSLSDDSTTSLFPGLLTGGQEVPPVTISATGTGSFVLNATKTALTYDITVDGLSGAGMTGAHFHNAAAGLNSAVERNIIGDFAVGTGTATGVWSNTDVPSLSDFLTEFEAGRMYVNVHTVANPGGEIRTQVILTPAGSSGFTAKIDSLQEVTPPTITTIPTGTGTFTLNLAKTELTFVVTVTNLSGVITNAHFHNAAAGVDGGFVRTIFGDFIGNTATGVWRSTDSQSLTPFVTALEAGNIYVNIHTLDNGPGEIRGQVIPNL
ncbi:MAG: CHRD domain-containing protein [Nitrospira sp.]|nr:CHRD domain-containing protein [Candidatus Manganitrophaceae bacterium]HIL35731.1 CHRD domain-containing protein [Candidatus Manganitrophaceae bacterium]